MIVLLMRSTQSAKAIAGHLRGSSAKGWLVFYFSNDFRAIELAVALAKKKAIVMNSVLRLSSLFGVLGGSVLLSFSENSVLTVQIGQFCFYAGVIVGMSLIGLESLWYK